MSGHSDAEQFVVVADAKRRWSRAEKLAMLAEAGTSSVSAVARRYNVATSLLFRWRREIGNQGPIRPGDPSFVPVALSAPVGAQTSSAPDGLIEIVLAGNRRVIVGKGFDPFALKQVVDVLNGK